MAEFFTKITTKILTLTIYDLCQFDDGFAPLATGQEKITMFAILPSMKIGPLNKQQASDSSPRSALQFLSLESRSPIHAILSVKSDTKFSLGNSHLPRVK